ncbi:MULTISPECIES: phage integrase N-terminal SAM-like domain-containing protein [unclassified Halomonas]
MDRVRATLRVKHYSFRTEKTYCYRVRFFTRFQGTGLHAAITTAEVRQHL